MSGKSEGAQASKTGSEIERKDEIEGSKDDFESGSTTKSPAALAALQTVNDEGLVPWASLQSDDLKMALLRHALLPNHHQPNHLLICLGYLI